MSPLEERSQRDVSPRALRVIRFYRIMLWLLPVPVSVCLLVGGTWLCDRFHWQSGHGIGAWLFLSFVVTVGIGLFDYQFHRLNPTLRTPLSHVFVFLLLQILISPILVFILGLIVFAVDAASLR